MGNVGVGDKEASRGREEEGRGGVYACMPRPPFEKCVCLKDDVSVCRNIRICSRTFVWEMEGRSGKKNHTCGISPNFPR